MKNLLILALLFVSTLTYAQIGLRTTVGSEFIETKAAVATMDLALEKRLDIDKSKYINSSNAAFVIGVRYGVSNTYEDIESANLTNQDYFFTYLRGYFDIDADKIKGTATIQYDWDNQRFFYGGGFFFPIAKNFGFSAEAIVRDIASTKSDTRQLGFRVELSYKIGR